MKTYFFITIIIFLLFASAVRATPEGRPIALGEIITLEPESEKKKDDKPEVKKADEKPKEDVKAVSPNQRVRPEPAARPRSGARPEIVRPDRGRPAGTGRPQGAGRPGRN
jgi:hypothetical protein